MSQLASDLRYDAWTQKVTLLETALQRVGRDSLLPTIAAIRQLLLRFSTSTSVDHERAFGLLGRALMEVKACVVEAGREPTPDLLVEIESTLGAHGVAFAPLRASHVKAVEVESTVDSEEREAYTDEQPDWIGGFIDGLGDIPDDQLLSLVAPLSASSPRAGSTKSDDGLGTLREPLHGLRDDRNANARVLMKGELQPGILSDLVQLFAQNRETGRLFIEGTSATASIYFKDGKITDAECGNENGERGFFNSLMIREGRFSYQRGVEAKEVRIFRSAQYLIMDTLRVIDETQSGS